MDVTVRRARPHDAGRVLVLLKAMHREAPVALEEVHDAKAVCCIVQASEDGALFLAEDERGSLVGVLGGIPSAPWFSLEKSWGDIAFYVHPRARVSRAAAMLTRPSWRTSPRRRTA